jgi:L-threonylcarbamoyladenylate synthase
MNPQFTHKSPSLPSTFSSDLERSSLPEEVRQAIHLLKQPGGIVCFKLDHRYVLGACAFDDQAIQRILEIKQRKVGRPLVVAFNSLKEIENIQASSPLLSLLKTFPYGLTLSIPAFPSLSRSAHLGMGMIGVRLMDDPIARTLIEHLGYPLVISSANVSGSPSANHFKDLEKYEIPSKVDLILSSPPEVKAERSTELRSSSPSQERTDRPTVVGLVQSQLTLFSKGSIEFDDLRTIWTQKRR